ncbi:hypothetical protein MBCUT_12890 [Methanobrevibacter cuticularis]|uniref:Cell wall biosynthesis protein n=1 Tax=Methanobrevibacter cuticularis TaxID=47311 RepID=A0A166DNG4_9EURY|nr:cell wall biosynthesis protein [Methanobrevibacter cuticularis]KZX15786.1 hypothetical protein MBCUT_12890 [Methanobrevibacter cuticularis]
MNFQYVLIAFLISLVATLALTIIFRFFGKRGFLGNLYTSVRGGTPRALGLIPFIILSLFFLPGYNDLILIIGSFAFVDDLIGRKKIGILPIEWGQLSRGIGMIAIMIVGFPLMGYSAILISLLIQPINISDMQPGSTSMVVIIMSIFTILAILLMNIGLVQEIPAYYTPLILLVVCLGYCPLDFSGNIMLGEVGNHSFAVALGICFYILGGFWWTLILFIATTILISLIRKNNLTIFFARKLKITNPAPGDYFMDVLTGGGLGDALRRVLLGKRQIIIKNPFLILLGFRRLLYNPFAPNNRQYIPNKYQATSFLDRK